MLTNLKRKTQENCENKSEEILIKISKNLMETNFEENLRGHCINFERRSRKFQRKLEKNQPKLRKISEKSRENSK